MRLFYVLHFLYTINKIKNAIKYICWFILKYSSIATVFSSCWVVVCVTFVQNINNTHWNYYNCKCELFSIPSILFINSVMCSRYKCFHVHRCDGVIRSGLLKWVLFVHIFLTWVQWLMAITPSGHNFSVSKSFFARTHFISFLMIKVELHQQISQISDSYTFCRSLFLQFRFFRFLGSCSKTSSTYIILAR